MSAVVIDLTEYRQRKQQTLERLRTEAPPQELADSVLGPDTDDWDEHDLSLATFDLVEFGFVRVRNYSLAQVLVDLCPGAMLEGKPGEWYRVSIRR